MSRVLENFKSTGKKGVSFLKGVTVDTFTAVRDDIRQSRLDHARYKAWLAANPYIEPPKDTK